MTERTPVTVSEGVETTLISELKPAADNRKLGGTATYQVRFKPNASLAIPGDGPDEAAPDLTLIGVTDGEIEVTLVEGTGFYNLPDDPDNDIPLEPNVAVRLPAGAYAALQSKGHAKGGGDGGHATTTTQGGRCRVCPGRG